MIHPDSADTLGTHRYDLERARRTSRAKRERERQENGVRDREKVTSNGTPVDVLLKTSYGCWQFARHPKNDELDAILHCLIQRSLDVS